jgi:hypothetical protein
MSVRGTDFDAQVKRAASGKDGPRADVRHSLLLLCKVRVGAAQAIGAKRARAGSAHPVVTSEKFHGRKLMANLLR